MNLTKQQEEILSSFLSQVNAMHYLNAKSIEEFETDNRLYYTSEHYRIARSITDAQPYTDDVYNKIKSIKNETWKSDRIHAMHNVLKNNNFDKKGKVLPNAIYNNVKGHGIIELYRGFKSAKEIEDFKNGDFYIGEHLTGNGMYFTTDYFLALRYADNVPQLVVRVKIDLADLYIVDGLIVEVALFSEPNVRDWFHLLGNVGNYAATKNIDVIRRVEEYGKDVIVILNRGKLIIERDPTPIKELLNLI